MKEKLSLAAKASNLEKKLHVEKEISAQFQSQLDLQYKKIHMFAGTRQLDKILSYGRTETSTEVSDTLEEMVQRPKTSSSCLLVCLHTVFT
ncbi:unnamed protein product [Arabis nemorensis]|uniref:Uncharacterized protein n=1 Tax=Arabis nemorensis TaxID=586526 RepID=A0A565B6M2_9BRAS|nr:unnamed protein product [Arabis nemorensis]